jgi:hypothetical protein
VVCVLVLIDGLMVNRVPVRLKHFPVVFVMTLLYLIWSIIQNLVVENNPNFDDDDDALYDVLSWKKDPKSAAIVAVIVLMVVSPTIFMIVWGISLCSRRYVEPEGEEQEEVEYEMQISPEMEISPENEETTTPTLY